MTGPEQVVRDQMRERRRTGIIWLILALILAMVLGFAFRTDSRADGSDRSLAAANSQVDALKGQVSANGQLAQSAKDAADEANRRLAAAGKPTVPVPTEAPISPSVAPPQQQDEFTADEAAAVRLIVADQIARTPAKLTQAEITQIARVASALVPRAKDGKTPTAAELQPIVSATLAAYCVGDKCVGKTGTNGANGKDGRNGENGKDAPAVTDAQLLAAAQQALAAYCAQDSKPCQGTPGIDGKDGTDGKSGADGRGIADTDCQDDGTWLITYSDGTTDTARGPCRIVIPPTEAKTGN
jgi:hypothetical protein